jgi:sulfonate transport system substrate-binding protein
MASSTAMCSRSFWPPDARAAFEKGSVDAWVIWDPFLASAQKALDARLLADARAWSTTAPTTSPRVTMRAAMPMLRIAIEEIAAIDAWASKNKSAAAAELSQILGLDTAVTELYLSRAEFGTKAVNAEILGEQQKIADTFFDLKLIPKKLNLLHAAPVDLLASR